MSVAADENQRMVAAFLATRRRSPRSFDVPVELRPLSPSDGYRVLLGVHQELERAGNARIGFKVACTTDATRKAMGTDTPAYAGLFESDRFRSLHATVASQAVRTGYECELAVRIDRDVDQRATSWQDVLRYVGAVAVACEVVINRYGDPKAVGLPSLIADDWFQAGYVIGDWVAISDAPSDLAGLMASVKVGNSPPISGWSREVMGHPLVSLAWLATALLDAGDQLRAGDVVLTGAIVAPIWLESAPSSMRMTIDGVGALAFPMLP